MVSVEEIRNTKVAVDGLLEVKAACLVICLLWYGGARRGKRGKKMLEILHVPRVNLQDREFAEKNQRKMMLLNI